MSPGAAAGRVLGLDPGSVRVGVAISDSARTMAFPRPALESGDALAEQVAAIVTEESVTTVVVGRPLTLRGTSGTAADAASALRQRLAAHLPANVEVTEFDERLSTVEAAGRLRAAGADARSSRSRVDSAAATVLVEAYLAAQR